MPEPVVVTAMRGYKRDLLAREADQMREMGFGFGMGLPNIRRNADEFTIESEVGKGTTVSTLIRLDSSA